MLFEKIHICYYTKGYFHHIIAPCISIPAILFHVRVCTKAPPKQRGAQVVLHLASWSKCTSHKLLATQM